MKLRVICVIVGFLSLVLSLAAQTPGSSPASPASTITGRVRQTMFLSSPAPPPLETPRSFRP